MASSSNCQPPIGSFSESNDGNVFFARGDQSVKRWDGLISDFVNAGVPAPSAGLSMSEESVYTDDLQTGGVKQIFANIAGTYFAYLRFLDSRGRVSNLSPVAGRLSMSGIQAGYVDGISYIYGSRARSYGLILTGRGEPNWRYIVITSSSHSLETGEHVHFSGFASPGGGAFLGNTKYRVYVLNANQFVVFNTLHPFDDVNSSPVSQGFHQVGAGVGLWAQPGNGIKYSDVEIPTDSRVVRRQILRNKDGNVNTFYVDIDDTELTETEFTTLKSDPELGEEVPLRAVDGTDLNIARHSEPPSFKRVIVDHFSRTFAAVNLNYKVGSANVEKDSTDVIGNGTCWTAEMEGRLFFAGGAKSYTVSSVDAGNQQLVLSEEYEGSTDRTSVYSISPEEDEKLSIHFSETLLPESWNRYKVIRLTSDPSSGAMTGLMPMGPRLFILFENRISSLNYMSDPSLDGQVSFATSRGCLNQRCYIKDGNSAYLMDQSGVYAFDGSQTVSISDQIQSVFDGTDKYSVDWSRSEYFHATHQPREKVIRWFVCLGGSGYPKHALAFNYLVNRWWIEEYVEPISSSVVGSVSNKRTAILCGSAGRVFIPTHSPVDGMATGASPVRGSVSSSTSVTITDSSKTFTDGMVGAPVCISEGTGSGQQRVVVSVGEHHLEVNRPFSILPDSTSVYQVGGFKWEYSTPMMRLASQPNEKAIRSFAMKFEPNSEESTLIVRKYVDFQEAPDSMHYSRSFDEGDGVKTESSSPDILFDMTRSTGVLQQNFDGTDTPRSERNRSLTVRLEGVPNAEAHRIYSLTIEGVSER